MTFSWFAFWFVLCFAMLMYVLAHPAKEDEAERDRWPELMPSNDPDEEDELERLRRLR